MFSAIETFFIFKYFLILSLFTKIWKLMNVPNVFKKYQNYFYTDKHCSTFAIRKKKIFENSGGAARVTIFTDEGAGLLKVKSGPSTSLHDLKFRNFYLVEMEFI